MAPDEAGSPEDDITCTPGVVPASALVTSVLTLDSIVCASTIEAEPVKELFVAVPYVRFAVRVDVLPCINVNAVLLRAIPVGLRVILPADSLNVKLVGNAVHCAYSV